MSDCRTAATALPGVDTLAVLAAAAPAGLSGSDLVDAVVAAERLLAHVNGLQVRLLAELGLPNRCADVSDLVAALVDKAGVGRGPGGEVDPEVVAAETADRSVGVAAAEVAAVLDCSPVTARIRIRQAMRMVSALPATAAALEQGRVDVGRARMLVDRTGVLSAGLCGPIERRLLPLARGRSKARLETLVDREVIAADPAAAENRRLAARKDRSVSHRVDKDGMGVITALLPAEAAVVVFTLVDLIAAANKGLDGRTVDQRRADAVADIADELLTFGFVDLDGLVARAGRGAASPAAGDADADADADATGTHPTNADTEPAGTEPAAADAGADTSGPADTGADADAGAGAGVGGAVAVPSSAVVVAVPDTVAAVRAVGADPGGGGLGVEVRDADADRAARLSRAATRHGRRPHLNVTGAWTTLAGLDDLPGHLDGYGTITAELLRAIGKSWGTVTAVGVDPASGTATAVGGLTYRPRLRVSDEVILVSGTCRAAGCRIPASKCDLDHVVPFNHADPAAGGHTTAAGQLPYCRFHHLLKHHTDWTPHLQPDMTVVWTTATGHAATSYPREFTGPGEWERAADEQSRRRSAATGADSVGGGAVPIDGDGDCDCDGDGDGDGDVAVAVGGGAVPIDGAGAAGPPEGRPDAGVNGPGWSPDQQLIIGPMVTGPTIPVIPAGTDYQEPNTELEDPTTIPHPGSVEINTYRTLREDTRYRALRRIGRIAALSNRDHNITTRDHNITTNSDGHSELEGSGNPDGSGSNPDGFSDPDGFSSPDGKSDRAGLGVSERQQIQRNLQAVRLRRQPAQEARVNRPKTAPVDVEAIGPLPNEPPF